MTDCREKLIGLRKCCTGHQWDERTESCKKCGSGYFGVNCGQSCDFPDLELVAKESVNVHGRSAMCPGDVRRKRRPPRSIQPNSL
ncbi:uncharacterized protein LOC125656844 isoform X3 [Ostrea edulis]|uniref:uncharacterized protein LOC125656844 isoform X3 n=1 Tax=Ostrea edulis TaxID=37623 RepID=UPI0024AF173A|nr:uncharacterized protein LOC125656844 isoform X3 [Ostrea edulis]